MNIQVNDIVMYKHMRCVVLEICGTWVALRPAKKNGQPDMRWSGWSVPVTQVRKYGV